jgi:subtilase family serine protease
MNQASKCHGVLSSPGLRGALCSAMLLFVVGIPAQAQSLLTRHVREDVASGKAQFLYRMPETQTMRLNVVLAVRDSAGLAKFLEEVYDPTSPSFRHFLTVPEFTARFGPTQDDYDAAVHYLTAKGFKIVGGSRDAMDVQIEGSVTSVQGAFNVSMGVYLHPTENRTFYAPDREPTAALSFSLWHISGLDNYSIPHAALVHANGQAEKSNATTGSGPSASFLGSDMRAAYYGGTALTGSGQTLGLLEYYGTDLTDLSTYFSNAKQTNNVPITLLSTDKTSTSCTASSGCDDTEQTLDMTQAIGMAPSLSSLIMFVGSTDTAILGAMTSHSPLPLELSSSWTWTPDDPGTDDPYFEKMASQGQSFFQAAGDSGKWTSSTFPSEDPNVICVGGTDLTTSSAGGPWSGETVWVDGGGGISTDHLAIPSYQKLTGVITSTNKGSTTYRNGPDVAANANFTFYVCADQTTCTANEYGGTSFAAPMWAGYIALANQQAGTSSPVGFINPTIYPIGLSSSYDADFHDITSGSNGYSAVVGYDLATGWGSPNGAALINALTTPPAPGYSVSASPSSVSVVQGSAGTSTITATFVGGFTGSVTLSASGQPSGVTVGFGTNPISTSGGTSVMTMTVGSTTATGTYTITVTGTSGTTTETTTVSLTVTAPVAGNFSLSANPTSLSVRRGSSGTSTITSTVSGGFDSAVALTASGMPTGVTPAFSPTSITGTGTSTLKLTVGSSTTTGTYTITITGTSGSLSHTTTVSLRVRSAL